jgi:hypothetical protein
MKASHGVSFTECRDAEGVNENKLPVVCRLNEKGWIMPTIFKECFSRKLQ